MNNILENPQPSSTANKNYTDFISFVGTDDRTGVLEKRKQNFRRVLNSNLATSVLHFHEVLHVISYGKYNNQVLISGHAPRPGYSRAAVKVFLVFHFHFRQSILSLIA